MVQLLLVIIALAIIFGPGAAWPVYGRGSLAAVVLIIVILWFLLGPHHPRYLY